MRLPDGIVFGAFFAIWLAVIISSTAYHWNLVRFWTPESPYRPFIVGPIRMVFMVTDHRRWFQLHRGILRGQEIPAARPWLVLFLGAMLVLALLVVVLWTGAVHRG